MNHTATAEIYTLSLHDALPIWKIYTPSTDWDGCDRYQRCLTAHQPGSDRALGDPQATDRKSTRLNSSHANISYAVFCLKKKKHIHLKILHVSLQLHNVLIHESR